MFVPHARHSPPTLILALLGALACSPTDEALAR